MGEEKDSKSKNSAFHLLLFMIHVTNKGRRDDDHAKMHHRL